MKIIRRIILLLVMGAAVAVIWLWTHQSTSNINWRTAKIERGDMDVVITALGILNPTQTVSIGTQASGQINQIYVHANEPVAKGQLMAEIDPELSLAQMKEAQSAAETARLSYEQAARDLKRTEILLAKQYIAQVELEHAQQAYYSARNSYESAKSALDRARTGLKYTKIYSPIDGVVLSQEVTPGQTVNAGFEAPKLFTVASNLAHMKIDVNFSESDIVQISVGMPVTFTVAAFPDEQFSGTVEKVNINPTSTNGSTNYYASLDIDNSSKKLLPGMTAYISIIQSQQKNVLHVPAAALRFAPAMRQSGGVNTLLSQLGMQHENTDAGEGGGSTLYVLRDNRVVSVPVSTGIMDETDVAVDGDIREGDTVIVGINKD